MQQLVVMKNSSKNGSSINKLLQINKDTSFHRETIDKPSSNRRGSIFQTFQDDLQKKLADADDSLDQVLNQIDSVDSSGSSQDSDKNAKSIMKWQMSQSIRSQMVQIKEKSKSDSLMVLDIQKSL